MHPGDIYVTKLKRNYSEGLKCGHCTQELDTFVSEVMFLVSAYNVPVDPERPDSTT